MFDTWFWGVLLSIVILGWFYIFILLFLKKIKFKEKLVMKINREHENIKRSPNYETIKYRAFFGIARRPMLLCLRYFRKIYKFITQCIAFTLANCFSLIFVSGGYMLYTINNKRLLIMEIAYNVWVKIQDIMFILTFFPIIIFLICLIINLIFPKQPKRRFYHEIK